MLSTDNKDMKNLPNDNEVDGLVLFEGKQETSIRLQFGAAALNFVIWGGYFLDGQMNGKVAAIDPNDVLPLFADPRWGYAGLFGKLPVSISMRWHVL